ncbi:MAG: alpha/beta fold hydrolase [Gammaproteobacteria bacterium]
MGSVISEEYAMDVRERLLAALPVAERRLQLGHVSTAVLEGGSGSPVVLLHGPAGYAAHWLHVIPSLVATYRVIAPDLPGHGASGALDDPFDPGGMLPWLDNLLERTCMSPPALVGQTLGGAIAARFASERGTRLRALVLVDALGLTAFTPTFDFGQALSDFITEPNEDTHDRLWRYCAFDPDTVRDRMGEQWTWLRAYNVECARAPNLRATQQSLMEQYGMPAIPSEDLARISVPTSLIWGRHDLATALSVAQATSSRYGWPLHVLEACGDDPPVEQPEAFVKALHAVL